MTTDENDTVLDPFSGTGTTAISAKRLGRKYIGFELDKKYVEISRQKLERTKPNYNLGKSWVSFYLNDIVTIRNNDWNNLEKYFSIPNPIRNIDFERAKLIDKKLIPREISEKPSKINGKKVIEVENPTVSQAHLQFAQATQKPKPTKELAFPNTQTENYAAKK